MNICASAFADALLESTLYESRIFDKKVLTNSFHGCRMKEKRQGKEIVMRKKERLDLESKIRENIERFYKKAYTAVGEREKAEKLTENAVLYGAKRYADLMNKERFLDIIEQKIGNGEHTGVAPCDMTALSERIIRRARAWNIRSTVGKILAMVTAVCLIAIGAYSLIFPKLYEARSKEVPVMRDTIAIAGDYDISELVNYQRVSDKLALSADMVTRLQYHAFAKHLTFAVTAPNGTPYFMVNQMEAFEGESLPFALYRGDEQGWHEVAVGQMGGGYYSYGSYVDVGWWPSDIHMFSDNDGDIYIVVRLAEDILFYRYDSKTEFFGVAVTIPFHDNYNSNSFAVTFDSDFGETGTAYIVCRKEPAVYDEDDDGGWASVFRYDTATNTLSLITEELRLISENSSLNICAKNDIVYVTDCINGFSDMNRAATMLLNQIYPDGYVDFDYFEQGYYAPIVAMEMDEDGKLHIITNDGSRAHWHYVFSEDLTFQKGLLKMAYHHYEGTEYYRYVIGSFLGKDGRVYCLEYYVDYGMGERSFIAIGMLDSEDPAANTYINGFDLVDNVGHLCMMNEKDIWYITSEYNMDEAYLIYYHINELD